MISHKELFEFLDYLRNHAVELSYYDIVANYMKAYKISKAAKSGSHRLTNQTVLSSVHLVWFNVIKRTNALSQNNGKRAFIYAFSKIYWPSTNCFPPFPTFFNITVLFLAHVATRKCSAMAASATLASQKGNNSLRVCDSYCPQLALNKRHNNRVFVKVISPPAPSHKKSPFKL